MPTNAQKLTNATLKQLMPRSWPDPDNAAKTLGFTGPDSSENNPGEDLLRQAEGVASEQLAGSIPEDVQSEVMRISAENSLQSGLGTGQAARNMTARDLGLTSLQIQQAGQQAASDLAKTRIEQKKANDQFFTTLQGLVNERSKVTLAGLELASQNQIQAQTLANNLIINNSIKKIKGVQKNVNQLIGGGKKKGFLFGTNKQIRNFLGV